MNPEVTAVRRIVVLGGSSAGWLTAATLATPIESPDVSSIGAADGTWPTVRGTLQRIGLIEVDLIRERDAAFKQGSRFGGWLHGSDGDRYCHPFTLPRGWGGVPSNSRGRGGRDDNHSPVAGRLASPPRAHPTHPRARHAAGRLTH